MNGTTQLNWGWTEDGFKRRRNAIQTMRLPRAITLPNNGSVSAAAVRHVLRVLNEHAGGDCETFVGRNRIAEETGLSVSQVKRAITAMVRLHLVAIHRKKGRASVVLNHYRINWPAVQALGGESDHPELQKPEEATVHGGPSLTDQRSTVDGPTVHDGPTNGPQWTDRRSMVDPDSVNDRLETPSSTEDWEAAAAVLVSLGVRLPWKAIEATQDRGTTPDQVIALARHYEAHAKPEDWKPWLLFRRVEQHGPGMQVADGWPDPNPKREVAQQLAGEVAAQAKKREEDKRREAIASKLRLEREQKFGRRLDQLSKEDLHRLAESLGTQFYRTWITAPSPTRFRNMLLEAFEGQQQPTATADTEAVAP